MPNRNYSRGLSLLQMDMLRYQRELRNTHWRKLWNGYHRRRSSTRNSNPHCPICEWVHYDFWISASEVFKLPDVLEFIITNRQDHSSLLNDCSTFCPSSICLAALGLDVCLWCYKIGCCKCQCKIWKLCITCRRRNL